MRIPGLGGEVLRRAGGTPVGMPGTKSFTSLQSGVIDATEWVGPWNDLAMGSTRWPNITTTRAGTSRAPPWNA